MVLLSHIYDNVLYHTLSWTYPQRYDIEQIMTENDREKLLRQYAACEITWHSLRERGFDNYVEVLAGLGELGLRPPMAPMGGPNVEARERGRAMIREALKVQR